MAKKKNRIHYCFLIDQNKSLIPVDSASQDFLNEVKSDVLAGYISDLLFPSTTILSTIALNEISYSIKIVPVEGTSDEDIEMYRSVPAYISYIVVIQNQFLFADFLHKFGKYALHSPEFENLIKNYDDGLYLNDGDGKPLYFNEKYLKISHLKPEDLYKSFQEHQDFNLFEPVVTPIIMKNNIDLTTFQRLGSGYDIITTAQPIYQRNGSLAMILFLVSDLSHASINSTHILSLKKYVSAKVQEENFAGQPRVALIGESVPIKKCIQDAVKLSAFDVPCLLLGPSGSGKEVFASLIHATSHRNTNPFLKINCSALTSTLLESELFGYEAGAFTGAASKGRLGFFETCNHGTLLLDEIGDMPLDSQAKLLRVLETGEFYRVGGNIPIKVDVRIIASTNKNLKEQMKKGLFRSDLFYRLNVATINLPSLSERAEDIPLLINYFVYNFNQKYQTGKFFSSELITAFQQYSWPGNVRELRNSIERLILLSSNTKLSLIDITDSDIFLNDTSDIQLDDTINIQGIPNLNQAVDYVEKTLVKRALSAAPTTRAAADLLDVSQSTIMRKIAKFDLKEYN